MYLIVGLGNPGSKYDVTRHNIGFEVIEKFAYDNNIKVTKNKHNALCGEGIIDGKKVILIKPQTYMNNSGISVRAFAEFYNIKKENIIIVYDDVSLDVGKLRIRVKGSAGGHNGVKSIIQHLGTEEFTRIKVGVGEKPPGYNLANYVLGKFTKEEIEIMVLVVKKSSDALERIVKKDINYAMNNLNNI